VFIPFEKNDLKQILISRLDRHEQQQKLLTKHFYKFNRVEKIESQKFRDKEEFEAKSNKKVEIILNNYYNQGVYIGVPASLVVYELSLKLQFSNDKHLWYVILSISDFFLDNMVTLKQYTGLFEKINCMIQHKKKILSDNFEINKMSDTVKIQPIFDFRLPMLRHWTLLDAILNSSYVSPRLQTHSDFCMSKSWLAKIGCTSRNFNRLWVDLSPKTRSELADSIVEHAKHFNVADIRYKSFSNNCLAKKIMASDVVYAVKAILVFSQPDHAFWVAWNTIESENGLKEGIKLAKELRCALFSIFGVALRKKEIQACSGIKVYFLSPVRVRYDSKILRDNPEELKKIGFLIQECYLQETGNIEPCLVIGTPNSKGFCQIVAVPVRSGIKQSNPIFFPYQIVRAAKLSGSTYKFESFDLLSCEIEAKQIQFFLDQLQTIISTA
jgi:hypothetical protein